MVFHFGGADESVQMSSGSVVRGSTGPGAMVNPCGERRGWGERDKYNNNRGGVGGGGVALSREREAQATRGITESGRWWVVDAEWGAGARCSR